jgi:hypothetical protein
MNSHLNSLEDLQDRLLKLEKQNRRFKQLGVAALVIPALLLVMGQAPSKRTVEANEFILRDDSGNVRARLSTAERHITGPGVSKPVTLGGSEPALTLFDEKGQMRVTLDQEEIVFFDPQGPPRVTLGDGLGADLWLVEGDGSLATLTPNSLELSDNGGFAAKFGVTDLVTPRTGETHKTSAASVVLFDKDKNVIWKAP